MLVNMFASPLLAAVEPLAILSEGGELEGDVARVDGNRGRRSGAAGGEI